MSLLPGAIGRLLNAAESALAGWITLLIADHAPFVHLSQSQILGGIVFLVGAGGHYIHTHGIDTKIFGRVKKLEGFAGTYVGTAGVAGVEKELAALTGKVETLLHLHAASSTGNANSAAAVTKTSVTSAKAAAATK